MTLREPEQTAWLSGSMARELDMAPDALHFDYSEDTLSPAFNVTAAQSKEISALLTLIQTLKVHVTAITPDASALQRFMPYLPEHHQCLAWRDDAQWLWATRSAWDVNQQAILTVSTSLPRHCRFPRQPLRYAVPAASIR